MTIDRQRLETALSTIHTDKDGYFRSGRFVDLDANVDVKSVLDTSNELFRKLHRYLRLIVRGIWTLETIALRLAWQKDLWAQNQLGDSAWMDFAKCDVDLFHVEYRSIFDYLSKTIRTVSNSPAEISDKSFATLRRWLSRSRENAEKLGGDLARLVLSCEWFDDIKEIRESIVHRGGFSIVFLERGRILFQVFEGMNRKILIPEIMFNENVVDFELYAGLYMGYLLAYLEEASDLILNRLGLDPIGNLNAKSYHSGLRVIREWISQI